LIWCFHVATIPAGRYRTKGGNLAKFGKSGFCAHLTIDT
jgi:hypothetical protein